MVVQQLYVAPEAQQRPALQRIRRLSFPFEIVFAVMAAVVALLFAAVFALAAFGDPSFMHLRIGPDGGELVLGDDPFPPNSVSVSDLPLLSRLVGLVVLVGVLGTQIAAFFSLHKLFGAYRRGIVFAEAPIRWMRRAGFFLVAAAVAPLAFQPLVRASGLLDQRWFHGHSVAFLLVGAALFVLASIIALGREIEKEGEGYV